MKILQCIIAVLLCVISLPSQSVRFNEARTVGKLPTIDSQGRTFYIVDLTDAAADAYPDIPDVTLDRFAERHSAKARRLFDSLERQFGFHHVSATSFVGYSISAYLNPHQIARLSLDPRVTMISEVVHEKLSQNSPPWFDTLVPGTDQTRSWGWNAVRGKNTGNNQSPRIYLIDAGVGLHNDLGTVVLRVNPSGFSTVGCYPHATHVAGIIAATNNTFGVVGAFNGSTIISVSVFASNRVDANGNTCGGDLITSDSIAAAMDWVKADLVANNSNPKPGVVNISMNGSSFGPGQTNRNKMLLLSIPSQFSPGANRGAFIAQSAGNGFTDACAVSYGNASPSDGIMVVGAIDWAGDPVTLANGGFDNAPLVPNEDGSNFGACVEVWAPGNDILSSWGPNVTYDPDPLHSNTWQLQSTTYNNYVYLSGTSMAAPHVTAVAAYFIKFGASTPAAAEAQVRANFFNYGAHDTAGLPVNMARMPF